MQLDFHSAKHFRNFFENIFYCVDYQFIKNVFAVICAQSSDSYVTVM